MRVFLISIVSILLSFSVFSAEKNLRAYLDTKQFYAPGIGNYVEFHLQFVGYSVQYRPLDNGLIGDIGVKLEITQYGKTVQSSAYRLETPFMKDSIVEDFYDLKRIALTPGEYEYTLELFDVNSEADPLSVTQSIVVDDFSNALSISDIEVAEFASKGDESSPFYKSGYNLIPRLSTFYPQELNTLPVYFEIYNSTDLEDQVFGIKQTVTNADTGNEVEELTVFSKHDAGDVVPFLRKIDLTNVGTGKYILEYTIINRNMIELSKQSYEFERSNDLQQNYSTTNIILDPQFQSSITNDSIGFYLESLIPISKANGVRNIIAISKSKNEEEARRYIQMFWNMTAPDNPYEGWLKYKAQVQLVEREFANNFQEGFETDRGRVYLQYGSPNNIIVQNQKNPVEYPYEIWQYDKIGRFSNKQFIFYNPDLTNNAFRLLHSNMVGEINNPAWPRDLNRRASGIGTTDDPNSQTYDHWGGNADDMMKQF